MIFVFFPSYCYVVTTYLDMTNNEEGILIVVNLIWYFLYICSTFHLLECCLRLYNLYSLSFLCLWYIYIEDRLYIYHTRIHPFFPFSSSPHLSLLILSLLFHISSLLFLSPSVIFSSFAISLHSFSFLLFIHYLFLVSFLLFLSLSLLSPVSLCI